jgi:hypothetical protein
VALSVRFPAKPCPRSLTPPEHCRGGGVGLLHRAQLRSHPMRSGLKNSAELRQGRTVWLVAPMAPPAGRQPNLAASLYIWQLRYIGAYELFRATRHGSIGLLVQEYAPGLMEPNDEATPSR